MGRKSNFEKRVIDKKEEFLQKFDKVCDEYGKVAIDLINNTVFMAVTLEDLCENIRKQGTKIKFQNGRSQSGWQANPDVAIYNTMTKNFSAAVKQLTEMRDKLKPPVAEAAADEFDEFIKGGSGK